MTANQARGEIKSRKGRRSQKHSRSGGKKKKKKVKKNPAGGKGVTADREVRTWHPKEGEEKSTKQKFKIKSATREMKNTPKIRNPA